MKTLKTILCSSCLLFSLMLSAQKSESSTALPYSNKMALSDQALEALFQAQENVSVELSPGFRIVGKIQNKTDHGNSVNSLLIKLESAPGGMLSLSRYKDPQGHIFYSGHLLKLHEPDGMIIVENDHGSFLIKTQQRFLVAE
jgi:hypothetical protein